MRDSSNETLKEKSAYAFMPVYIGKSGDLVGCHRCLTDRQQKIELLSFSTVSSLSNIFGTLLGDSLILFSLHHLVESRKIQASPGQQSIKGSLSLKILTNEIAANFGLIIKKP